MTPYARKRYFMRDMKYALKGLDRSPWVYVTENQFIGAISLAFLGGCAFAVFVMFFLAAK